MDILELAHEWLRLDKDPVTRIEVQSLVEKHNIEELERRLRKRISFGTAGIRARVEAGFSRVNCLTTIQTSQGLAQHLIDTVVGAQEAGVVIGYDGRRDSRTFAQLAAAAFNAKGFRVIWYDEVVHTPLVPFGVRARKASAGIMITASHNPKDDNGYKVYGSNGCQINTPEDEAIQRSILLNLEPKTWEIPGLIDEREQICAEYFHCIAQLGTVQSVPRFSYTPMHGVGLPYLMGALDAVLCSPGHSHQSFLSVVPSQAYPDPEFPTVDYPNPEESGALQLAISHADEFGLKLVIANDPDADRLAVAEKIDSGWHKFTGDEIGVLLGYFIYQTSRDTHDEPYIMITSAVSSQMLAAIGMAEGFVVEETLTGFKWIGNRAIQAGERTVFGYEEALGYMLPHVVHDKDGVAAAVLLLRACDAWQGLPYKVLKGLQEQYGYFETTNTYWKSPDIALTKETFDVIRSNPTLVTKSFGPGVNCRIRDLSRGMDSGTLDGEEKLLPCSPGNMLITFWLTGHNRLCEGVRCTVRASGTEPKIKVYVECQSKISRENAQAGALEVLKSVAKAWFQDPRLKMESRYDLAGVPTPGYVGPIKPI